MHFPFDRPRAPSARPFSLRLLTATLAPCLIAALGCYGGGLNQGDIEDLSEFAGISASSLPASPTNAHANDGAAAVLGQRLFFDERMSSTSNISCATCHDPDHSFSEERPVSIGAFNRAGNRHAPTLWNVGFARFLFWDGRADSLWSQPLHAIEGEAEMDFTRVEVVRFINRFHRAEYESIFGQLPSISGLPNAGKPGDGAWNQLDSGRRNAVQRVFANVGKALEAYQRKLVCANTDFDRFIAGEVDLSNQERQGAAEFLRAGCDNCHNGPNFTDDEFHNIGIPHRNNPDAGRAQAINGLMDSVFNGVGPYSDNPQVGQQRLLSINLETGQLGAFKTPTLRGVGQRSHFGHLGSFRTLRDMVDHYDRNRGNGNNQRDDDFLGRLDPEMDGVNVRNVGYVVAFLRTLDCPPLPSSLVRSPSPYQN